MTIPLHTVFILCFMINNYVFLLLQFSELFFEENVTIAIEIAISDFTQISVTDFTQITIADFIQITIADLPRLLLSFLSNEQFQLLPK